ALPRAESEELAITPEMRLDRRKTVRVCVGGRLLRKLQAGRVEVTEINHWVRPVQCGEDVGQANDALGGLQAFAVDDRAELPGDFVPATVGMPRRGVLDDDDRSEERRVGEECSER